MLHRTVFRDYPVVPAPVDPARIDDPAYRSQRAEAARFTVNWASATGTAILLAAIASALYLRVSLAQFLAVALIDAAPHARRRCSTIMLMLSLGFVTRYGGTDATLGLAFTKTGWLYPFFADAARLARRRADRIRHQLERAVRQPAEDHRAAARVQSQS